MEVLLVVDVQNDFCPGGALPVPGGDEVVPVINGLLPRFPLAVATQDWHPPDHGSFAASHPGRKPGEVVQLAGLEQILWPVHCVQDTPGAAFHPRLEVHRIARVFRKGADREVDSYSAFFDNGRRRATGLEEYLRAQGATELYVCGLATDYCVRFTALDAAELGFPTRVILDACRGVELKPGDVEAAVETMRSKGIQIVTSAELCG